MTTTAASRTEDQLDQSPAGGDEGERTYHLEILLMSLAGLLLEISYTRVISFKLFYYYTYLVIGIALLGIGAGGVFVALSGRLRRASTEAVIMWGLLGGAVEHHPRLRPRLRDPDHHVRHLDVQGGVGRGRSATLLVICVTLFVPFAFIGVMIATLFGRRSKAHRPPLLLRPPRRRAGLRGGGVPHRHHRPPRHHRPGRVHHGRHRAAGGPAPQGPGGPVRRRPGRRPRRPGGGARPAARPDAGPQQGRAGRHHLPRVEPDLPRRRGRLRGHAAAVPRRPAGLRHHQVGRGAGQPGRLPVRRGSPGLPLPRARPGLGHGP